MNRFYVDTYMHAYIHTYIDTCIHTSMHTEKVETCTLALLEVERLGLFRFEALGWLHLGCEGTADAENESRVKLYSLRGC